MDQTAFNIHEDEEIRSAFPDYIDESVEETVEKCSSKLAQLMNQYKDEKNITDYLKKKMQVSIHATPSLSIIDHYDSLYKKYFCISDPPPLPYRITKYYAADKVPSVKVFSAMHSDGVLVGQLPWEVIQQHTSDDQVLDSLISIFNLNSGRIANHEQLLLWFPDLLKQYDKLVVSLMQGQVLSYDWRYYIAITGVACYGCEQLYDLLVQQFIIAEGDQSWIDVGAEAVPKKLTSILQICKLLALKTWDNAISTQLHDLIKGNQGSKQQDKWQKQELVHALCIFIFYNSLACFSMGNGVCNEFDLESNNPTSQQNSFSSQSQTDNTSLQLDFVNSELVGLLKDIQQSELKQQNEVIEQKQPPTETPDPTQDTQEQEAWEQPRKLKIFQEKFQKYVGHVEYPEAVSNSSQKVLRSSDFTFAINGYPMLKEVVPEVATNFFEFIKETKLMTKKNFGKDREIETEPFRRAVRIYVENIHRYQHDDVNYKDQQNKLLRVELKNFIKLVAQNPGKITNSVMQAIPISLNADEKCHITLLIMGIFFDIVCEAAKMEMQLVYLTISLNKFL